MIRDVDERGTVDESALMEDVRDRQMRLLIEEEEEAENAAQDHVLHEEQPETDLGLPSEAASGDKSEKVVENVGWAFLSVIQEAMQSTARHSDVNQEMLDAQGLHLNVESVIEKPSMWKSLIGGRNSIRTAVRIDGMPTSAEPDSSLFCKFGKAGFRKTICVVVEVCVN